MSEYIEDVLATATDRSGKLKGKSHLFNAFKNRTVCGVLVPLFWRVGKGRMTLYEADVLLCARCTKIKPPEVIRD